MPVHKTASPFGGAVAGTELGPLRITVAANLAILLFQTVATRPLLHTSQRLVSHRRAEAGTELTVTGTVVDRYEKRGRDYAVVEALVALPNGEPLWTSTATFCEQ